eukprot:GEMP01048239.1.p1 GENE.GEMP01048239.1~~GEMP01048239.1.p1  ORF type:complete len:380 (+),score=82.56 GEMP01048239.1:262-1401(+)
MTTIALDMNEMTQKMRIKETDDDRTTLSKKISYVLRYGVGKTIDLPSDADGFYRIKDILALPDIFKGVSEKVIKDNINRSNADKIRYEVKDIDGVSWIKAAGHRGEAARGQPKSAGTKEAKGGKQGQQRNASTKADGRKKGYSEDDFAMRWSLDTLARQKLHELPTTQRQLAMSQFAPNQNVPDEDFSKVFVAFCKRFRSRQGKGGNEDEDDDDHGDPNKKLNLGNQVTSQTMPLAGAMPFCPGVPWFSTQQKSPFLPWGGAYPSMPHTWGGGMPMPAPWAPGMNFTPGAAYPQQYPYGYQYGYNQNYKGKSKGVGEVFYNQGAQQQGNLNPNAAAATNDTAATKERASPQNEKESPAAVTAVEAKTAPAEKVEEAVVS